MVVTDGAALIRLTLLKSLIKKLYFKLELAQFSEEVT